MLHCTTLSHWIDALAALRKGHHTQDVAVLVDMATSVAGVPRIRPNLAHLAALAPEALPDFVRNCAVAMKYLDLLGPLDWAHFPERPGGRAWPGPAPAARAPFVAAFLVKVAEGHRHLGQLRRYLAEHPALVWVLGFPLKPDSSTPWGFDAEASLPSRKHFGRVLRDLPNDALQFLLHSTVQLLRAELPAAVSFGDVVSLDTKHILAWVKENNPKVYRKDRFDKTHQPQGDADCKLGCKRRENQPPKESAPGHESRPSPLPAPSTPPTAPPTPTTAGQPAAETLSPLGKGEFYWGYASGVVATRVALPSGQPLVEVVLAELTQTFDQSDISYFFPLMAQTETNLGTRPHFGALDKAYDSFYVHEYFTRAGGFAAVPWSDRPSHKKSFSPDGLPLCGAELPMPQRATFFQQTHCLVPHACARYACPLLFPAPTGQSCPIHHHNWAKGGCITTLPTSVGNRARHELDRESPAFKSIYQQRTAVERINSQALELGIEQPHLRNQRAIANLNTLIYVLINLRAWHRLQAQPSSLALAPVPEACVNA